MTNPPMNSVITPNSENYGFIVQITILAGSNFQSRAKVYLTQKGYFNITTSKVSVSSSLLMTNSLNIGGISLGVWNISIANSDGMTGSLAKGFTVKYYDIPGTITKPMAVKFYNTLDGSPTSWSWSFGDRSSNVTTRNTTHTYSTAGYYTGKLTLGGGS